jgi:hypothetical protein
VAIDKRERPFILGTATAGPNLPQCQDLAIRKETEGPHSALRRNRMRRSQVVPRQVVELWDCLRFRQAVVVGSSGSVFQDDDRDARQARPGAASVESCMPASIDS